MKRRTPKLPGLLPFKPSDYEWSSEPLSKAEIRAMRERLAAVTQELDAERIRRATAVAAIIQQDIAELAEHESKHKERVEMVAALMRYWPGESKAARKAFARRAVRRTLGTNI
jgi:hypothetical protein